MAYSFERGFDEEDRVSNLKMGIVTLLLLTIAVLCCCLWKVSYDLEIADSQVQELLVENVILTEQNKKLKRFDGIVVKMSSYQATPRQCDSTPNITASNKRIKEGMIAVSRPLLPFLPYGSKVQIGDKVYTVEDTMNKRFEDYRIDIYSNTADIHEEALLLVPFNFEKYKEKIIKEGK